MRQKLLIAAPVIGALIYADIVTKQWALESLVPGLIVEGFGGFVPMTLAFNEGVAFGLPLPSAGRYLVIFATILVLFVLTSMFVQARRNDWLRLIPIQLVAAGAIGNLIDRVRWDRGVVDFIGAGCVHYVMDLTATLSAGARAHPASPSAALSGCGLPHR